jgi:hypothetical protein
MLSLEDTIAEWRRQMLAAGIKTPVPLDELESHLRDEAEQQMRSGFSAQQAFETAVRQLGQASRLKTEFEKNNQRKYMKRFIVISAGILGILAGMAFVMPAVARYRHEGAMSTEEVVLSTLGAVLTLGGGSAAFLGVSRRRA